MSDLSGIHRGTVIDLSDPERRGRARLLVPDVLGASATGWATPVIRDGIESVTVGQIAWVFFEGGDVGKPTWLPGTSLLPPLSAANGLVITVRYASGWPPRPTQDPAVTVHWVGGTVSTPPTEHFTGIDLWYRPE